MDKEFKKGDKVAINTDDNFNRNPAFYPPKGTKGKILCVVGSSLLVLWGKKSGVSKNSMRGKYAWWIYPEHVDKVEA